MRLPFLVPLLSPWLAAQVPPGHIVVAELAYWGPACCQFPGGIHVRHPRIPGRLEIANVPSGLLGRSVTPYTVGSGTGAIAVRPTDGALLAGERVYPGERVRLHTLTLQGLTIVNDVVVDLGMATTTLDGVTDIAVLPSGDALVATTFAGRGLIRVSPAGAVTPVLAAPVASVAIDDAGAIAYVADASAISALPLAGGQPVALHSAAADRLSFVPPATLLYRVGLTAYALDIGSRIATPVHTTTCACISALSFERAGGVLFLSALPLGLFPGFIAWVVPGGTLQSLGNASWSVDVAIVDDPHRYGTPTPAARRYAWTSVLNPGGLPRIGNVAFGLQLAVEPPGSAAGLLVVATRPADFRLLGVRVLLDAATTLPVLTIPATGSIPLPIPANPGLAGLSVYFQSFHVDAGGLAASDGVAVGFLQ